MYYLLITMLISQSVETTTIGIYQDRYVKTISIEHDSLRECLQDKYQNDIELTKRLEVDIDQFTTKCSRHS